MTDLDLKQFEPWMRQCGPHDFGIDVGACGCPPDGDPRPVVSKLVAEVERLRGLVAILESSEPFSYDDCRPDCECPHSGPRSCGCHVTGTEAREWIRSLETERDGLEAAVARVEALGVASLQGVPPDGTYVLAHYIGGHQNIDEEKVWQRVDGAAGKEPHPDGDWWIVGAEHKGRHQWGEVLWHDDPVCDRGTVNLEWLIPVEDIARALDRQDPAGVAE